MTTCAAFLVVIPLVSGGLMALMWTQVNEGQFLPAMVLWAIIVFLLDRTILQSESQ